MIKIWCVVLLAFLVTGVCAAEVPDLVGNWTGSEKTYAAENGSYKFVENSPVSLSIIDQSDRLFTGNIKYILNGEEVVEALAGAIGLDNKTLYIAEFKEGYDMCAVISDDEIELIYLADGKTGQVSIDRLQRIK
jgi:hypothetical protein